MVWLKKNDFENLYEDVLYDRIESYFIKTFLPYLKEKFIAEEKFYKKARKEITAAAGSVVTISLTTYKAYAME